MTLVKGTYLVKNKLTRGFSLYFPVSLNISKKKRYVNWKVESIESKGISVLTVQSPEDWKS